MNPDFGWCLYWIACAINIKIAFGFDTDYSNTRNEAVSKAACEFTLNMLQNVESRYNSSNIVFSPASISFLLSVLQQGANGNTAKQLQQLLHLTAEETKAAYKNLVDLGESKNVTLEWGNKCYIKPGFQLSHEFRQVAADNFNVDVEEMDFGTLSPEDSAYKMNTWIEEVTHKQIRNLIEPSSITVETIMIMINAIFFKGNWLKPFKKGKTSMDKFEKYSGESVQTLFMTQRDKFYADKDSYLGAKWVKQPFENKRFSMIYVLPTKRHHLSQFLKKLKGDGLHHIFTHRGVSQVKLRIPKFKISEKVSLVDTLSGLGLTDIFTSSSDLSGISPGNLVLSDIIHQANVEIDEKGSTGSAATVIHFLRMGTPNLSFFADQPFLFFIIDEKFQIPLFAGKVVHPEL